MIRYQNTFWRALVVAAFTVMSATAVAADEVSSPPGPVDWLRSIGIAPRIVIDNDYASSISGGLSRGQTNAGGVVAGAELDMDKLVGVHGGTMHISFARYYGHSISATDIGNSVKVQGYSFPQRQWQLAQLTWEQKFADQHLTVLFGRVNTTWQFARSTYGCRFDGAPDCPYTLPQSDGGFIGFPYVNWGTKITYQPGKEYVALGAFEINPNRRLNHGLGWSTKESTGVVMPLETGYETSFKTDPYPRHYRAGVWWNNADYADPRLNTRGLPRIPLGGQPRMYDGGRFGAYLLGDQVVYRPDPTSTARNLAVFASISAPMDSAEVYTMQANAGFFWSGPFASRPGDSFGFMANYFRFTTKETGLMDDIIRKNHGTPGMSRDSTMMEVNYGIRLKPYLTLVPNVQYLVHPDILGRTTAAKFVPGNAVVLGLRLMLNLGGVGSN